MTNITSRDFSYGTRNLDENSVGNARDNSHLSYLSGDSDAGSYCHRTHYEDNGSVSDSADNFSYGEDDSSTEQRRATAAAAAGTWEENSSVSSLYSGANNDFSRTDDDEDNCDDAE